MFEIEFNGSCFAKAKTLEEAVSLALAVHRSSNVSHNVYVFEDGRTVLSFILDAVENPSDDRS